MILRILITLVASCLMGCSTLPSGRVDFPRATRFAVLPANALVPLAPELLDASQRMLGRVTRYLSLQGRERRLIEPSRTRQLWLASVAEVEATDSLPNDFSGAIGVFVRKLGESSAFDAIIVPSLVYRNARLLRGHVKWDGVVRRFDGTEDESRTIPVTFEASVPAVSLHLMVFDASGELVFENYGGVDLAHALSFDPVQGELVAELDDPVLGKHRHLSEGVEIAFEPYLLRPSSADW